MAASSTLSLVLIERQVLSSVIFNLPAQGTMQDVITAGELAKRFQVGKAEMERIGGSFNEATGEMAWKQEQEFETEYPLTQQEIAFVLRLPDAGVWPYRYGDAIASLYQKMQALK